IMIQFAPLGFAFLSIFIFRELPGVLQITGLLTACLGFGFFYWDQILISLNDADRFNAGNLWLLFAAATWIVFALAQKALLAKVRAQEFNLLMYGVSSLLLLPLADMTEFARPDFVGAGLILFLALNTLVAYGALSEALLRAPAAQVSVIIALNPLLTLLIMTVLTRMEVEWIAAEPIHWRGFVGALLVVIGVILTVTSPARLKTPEASSTI
ncbi:MAG: DMT family transporter, partial [Calothrix sp. SM1_5_4]|nr:DMT family transporter [Calothrix sp. SM1_5_4]